MKVHYPWAKTPVGGGFFVPTLRPVQVKSAGLRAALYGHMRGTGHIGIRNGVLGVLFRRTR